MAGSFTPRVKLVLTLLFGGALSAVMWIAAVQSQVWWVPDISPQKGEIDLSGTWKIQFQIKDDKGFEEPKWNDQNWCLISVPDSSLPAVPGVGDQPSNICPHENYPRDKMTHATYWYRKRFTIPTGYQWKEPSLFLGNIKAEGSIFWDGKFIGALKGSPLIPVIVTLSTDLVMEGEHTIAIRVTTGDSQFPGLFHAYKRKVTIGEFALSAATVVQTRVEMQQRQYPMVLNSIAFLLMFFLIVRTARSDGKAVALLGYFGFSALNAIAATSVNSSVWLRFTQFVAMGGMLTASLAYAAETILYGRDKNYAYGVLAALFGGGYSLFTALGPWGNGSLSYEVVNRGLVVISVLFFCAVIVPAVFKVAKKSGIDNLPEQSGTLFVLVMVNGLNVWGLWAVSATVSLSRILSAVLTLFIILMAIEDHIKQQRQLAFFGRFLRKGLKQLLTRNFKSATDGDKIFQGRKVPIMVLDMENHTRTTYGMPFGMKRIFQDLWFTTIDQVMENKTFMDKGMGDGSLYYFEEKLPQGSCRAALECAMKIRSEGIRRFDEELGVRLKALLASTSELDLPSRRFLAQYQKASGHSFWERETHIRAVLAYGFVDEGLWGLNSQGHYDVEGDLVTLTARLEKHASSNEIIITRPFYEALLGEWPEAAHEFRMEWKSAELKGIGSHEYGLVLGSAEEKMKIA